MAMTKHLICGAALLTQGALSSELDLKGGVIKLDWSDCGDASTHGHITSLTPSTLNIGDKTSIAGKGSVDEPIKAASYKVTAKALGITVFSHQGDACKAETIKLPAGAGTIDLKGFNCPLSKGAVELDLDITLASTIPAKLARTTIDLEATAASGDKALCVQIKTSPATLDQSKSAAPERPHLAQAWSALSSGDGVQGETGLEHYIYTRDSHANTGMNGHIWDYGASCKKVEVDVGFKPELGPDFYSGTFYVNCDAVDCCYDNDSPPGTPPDVKQWDINKPGLLRQVNFKGYNDTTELNDNPVKQAEHWQELDKLPFTKGVGVSYDHFITRSAPDIISHRIDYTAPGTSPGSILYGNFTVAHNLTAHQNLFKVPEQCRSSQIMSCNPGKVTMWEEKYFKHSFAMKSVAKRVLV